MEGLQKHTVTRLTDLQRVGRLNRGQIDGAERNSAARIQTLVFAENAVEALVGFARDQAIGQAQHGKKVAALNVLAQSVGGNSPVDLPMIVSYADYHRRAVNRASFWATRNKIENGLVVKANINARVKGRLHTFWCVVAEPQVWGRFIRAPRQTWRYAAKYSHATCRIHASSLGGFTIEGPFYRRPSRVARALDRFFFWLGA